MNEDTTQLKTEALESITEGKNPEESGKTAIVKHPGGRPTKYDPKMVDQINEYLRGAIPENMKIPTIEGIALKLGISRETLYQWAKEYPEFSDTIEKTKTLQKEYLQEIGIFGGKEINATIVALLLKVNHDMVEKTATDITSRGEKVEGLVIVKDGSQTE
jgi:hypothetical protein